MICLMSVTYAKFAVYYYVDVLDLMFTELLVICQLNEPHQVLSQQCFLNQMFLFFSLPYLQNYRGHKILLFYKN